MGTQVKWTFEYFFEHFQQMAQKCEQFSYGPFFFRCFEILGPKWSPYVCWVPFWFTNWLNIDAHIDAWIDANRYENHVFWCVKTCESTNYQNNKIYKLWTMKFILFFEMFQTFPNFRIHFGIFGLFCTINCYCEYRIRILCI